MDGKGYTYLENQAFLTMNLPQSFRLLAISHLCWCSHSEVFVNVWLSLEKSIGEFSMVYKKWVLWCGLGPIITILASNYNIVVQLFKVCLEDSGYAFVSRASCDKSAKKWYLMHMYISWLCPLILCLKKFRTPPPFKKK